jgi:hypothetical protein
VAKLNGWSSVAVRFSGLGSAICPEAERMLVLRHSEGGGAV